MRSIRCICLCGRPAGPRLKQSWHSKGGHTALCANTTCSPDDSELVFVIVYGRHQPVRIVVHALQMQLPLLLVNLQAAMLRSHMCARSDCAHSLTLQHNGHLTRGWHDLWYFLRTSKCNTGSMPIPPTMDAAEAAEELLATLPLKPKANTQQHKAHRLLRPTARQRL